MGIGIVFANWVLLGIVSLGLSNKELTILWMKDYRFLDNLEWRQMFPSTNVSGLPFLHTDHQSIQISLRASQIWIATDGRRRKTSCFHFEKYGRWMRNVEVLIVEAWSCSQSSLLLKDFISHIHNCVVKVG